MILVGLAVFAGQLSIGWSNDAIDADRDRRAGRADKPVAIGALSVCTLRGAAAVALLLAVLLSLALGVSAAVVHLVGGVAMGWAYNLGLKSSPLSPVPYAIAFGSLPNVASLAVTGAWAPLWLAVAGGAIGIAAHIANVLPDLADDAATGVRGLPHRLGARRARWTAAVVLAVAVTVVLWGAGLSAGIVAVVVGAALICLALMLFGGASLGLPSIMALVLLIIAVAGGRLSG